ncbi:MarR family transcriptional regulator [Streptomyces cocklensis]|uniref:DNA-binding transcriptional regulator, MarR family n=1 Tax=Actinacidiphila cocklensis TaxID=887465 RepID=A0A9W4DJN3_9ACTN|nr:MarR family transcriptional regulator [Actinacidiphila cocklensis]MDD1061073.1 MarR family transcriptional regulator [Actinacidiphila cocklensis]CAG6391417.1 DNA-binding transcriptional regulator, MarR family [Actinacidiphila cocklensis]
MDGDALSAQAVCVELPPGLTGCVVYLLRRAALFAGRLAPDFSGAADGVGGARDFQLLDALGEPGAAYSQQDLGDRLGINRTTMVTLIDRFEAAGHVTRARNPDDRRSYVLALTEGGRAAVKATAPAVSAADDKLTAGLTVAERDRLDALLAQLLSRPAHAPHRTGALIAQAHHFVRHRVEAALAESVLPARHFGALAVLSDAACSQQQLARRLCISEQAVLQVVDDLERAGRVVRDRDPHDRRRYALRITEPGLLALATARGVVEAAEAGLGTAPGAGGRAELAGLLAALLRAEG